MKHIVAVRSKGSKHRLQKQEKKGEGREKGIKETFSNIINKN